jgi:hypothetical protein
VCPLVFGQAGGRPQDGQGAIKARRFDSHQLLSGAGAHFSLFTAPFLLHLYRIEFLSQTTKVQ